ncbi:COG1574 Predicted metal-dependent hydrolase with the TIM-barrel fold [Candidatus Nanopelagicaceae bacterium]
MIDGSKIVAVGEDALAQDADKKIDLQGKFLAPGFIDSHAHPLFAGRENQGPVLNGLQSVEEMVEAVRVFAEKNPDKKWIIGGAYEAAIVARGDFLATWLDEAVSDRPVLLNSVDHHTVWVNSKALEIAGISAATHDPEGGSIARSSDGTPKGTLREPSAIDLVMKCAPKNTLDDDVEAIGWACQQYLQAGVTSATDAWVEPGMPEAYIAAAKTGALTIDMNLFFLAQPDSWRERSKDFQSFRAQIETLGEGSLLQAKTIKFICDGALSAGTAALIDPYDDDPQSRGLLIWSDDELIDAMVTFDAMGFQIHAHAIGDAAIAQALRAIAAVQRVNPPWDRRPVIAHAQLIAADDLKKFAELGVIANIQPLWTYLDPMNKTLILPRIGEKRNNQQYQLKSLLNSGAALSYGSDWPVTSYLPLLALGVPTHRSENMGSAPWSPEESITVEDSLTAYTYGSALSNFWEPRLGVLDICMDADLVVLEKSPLEVDPHDILDIEILEVFKAGVAINQYF